MHAQVHLHGIGTQSSREQGGSRPSKNEKNECFWTKTDAIRAKINQILFVQNTFFCMIILITPEINIIDYQFRLTS